MSKADRPQECFVVMPFDKKPMRDGTGRMYDFDKVYRVIIQRAIRQAGMQPVRADERLSSAIIHTEMFKDLRDQPVVLADLSLGNPNVLYELGIRHVMSNSGTVLICCEGSDLPFDVHLSRVVFYKYDGQSLDWEEVERVVAKLQLVLQQARRGEPDSPVHALLETVLREAHPIPSGGESRPDRDRLDPYQKLIARTWRAESADFTRLFEENRSTLFGARSLGYYCLEEKWLPDEARRVALHLVDAEQYALANRILKRLREEGSLDNRGLLSYASSYSEEHPDVHGAETAIAMAHEALDQLQQSGEPEATDQPNALEARAHGLRRLAGLQQWKWQLTEDATDLETALATWSSALLTMEKARSQGGFPHPGLIAQGRLKMMILLRIREGNLDRTDAEGHCEAVLSLKPRPGDDPRGISHLSWYQAIVLADLGAAEPSQKKALMTLAEDAKIMNNPDYWEIGRRQYVRLRRFIEHYSKALRHRTLIGRISQILQAGHQESA